MKGRESQFINDSLRFAFELWNTCSSRPMLALLIYSVAVAHQWKLPLGILI